jgi:molecular chaperone GrpE
MPDPRDQKPFDEFVESDVRQPAGADAPPPEPDEVRSTTAPPLDEDSEQLRNQRDEYYDRLLRQAAEFDNYRKRIERERREQGDLVNAEVMRELLPLVDDLERALQTDVSGDAVEAYRRGVEIIHRQLLELLRKRGVRPIESVGADFDPHFHESVAQEITSAHRDGEVLQELRRGYMIGDRLLRPAMVKVAKA